MSEADDREGVAAKRSKTNDDSDNKEGLLRMIEELNARNEELESENRVLRGEGRHDDSRLPVVTKRTVDLSRVDPSLVTQVASFLCRSRELLGMALTCKAFGQRRPSGSSLVEEAARQLLVNHLRPSDFERNALPQYGNGTIAWLPILHELEKLRIPLKFSKLVGRGMEYSGGSESSVFSMLYSVYSTAIANYVMKRGVHYASFKLIGGDDTVVGVARPFRDFGFVNETEGFYMFDNGHFDGILAQRTAAWVGNVHCCQYQCSYGTANWTDFQGYKRGIHWEGSDKGDTVGLLVDLNEGSLSVYKNGRFLAMAKDGLAGEYCFFSAMCDYSGVSIERETPP